MNEHLGDGKKVQLRSSESVWSASAHSIRAGGSSEQHSYREVSWLLENKLSNSPGLSSLPLQGKYLFAAEGAICQCTHYASSCLPAEGAASGQYWQLENPSTSGWLSCWDHTWTQKMVNECWHGNALSSASMVPVPCGSPQVFYHALFLDRRANLIAPLCTSLIVSNLEDAESKHLGDLPLLNLIDNYQLSLLAQSGLSLSPLCALGWHSLEHTQKEAEKLFPRAPCFRGTAAAVFISEGRKDVPCV